MTDLIKGEHGGALPLVPVEPAEVIPPFDYTKLDADFADELQRTADRVRERSREAIEIGRDLLAVKDRLEHGDFTAWVEDECGLKVRTAQRFMQAAALIAKYDKLSYLPVDGLAALSSPRAPKATVDGIIARIEFGDRPSAAAIAREIAAAKPKVARTHAGAAPALEPGGKPTEEAAGSSVEQELAVLNDAWERASPEARQLFLAQREAVLTTPPVAAAESPATPVTLQPPPEPSEAPAALPPRPEDGGNSILPTENDIDRLVLSSSTAAANDDDIARKSAVGEPQPSDPGSTRLGGDRQSLAAQSEETQPITGAPPSVSTAIPEAFGGDAANAEAKEAAPVPESIAPVAPGQLASLKAAPCGWGPADVLAGTS